MSNAPQRITVLAIRSGYNATQLAKASAGSDDPLDLHRLYVAR